MAFTPCAVHGAKYSGGANTFFLRLVDRGNAIGGKIQTCAKCATIIADRLASRMVKVSEGDEFTDYTEPLACSNCGGDVSSGAFAFFGNAYLRGHPETQWYGKVCVACRDAVAADFSLGAAR